MPDFVYNMSITLAAVFIGVGVIFICALSEFFARAGIFDTQRATLRLMGVMVSGLGLAFGAIMQSASSEALWLALTLTGLCMAYYSWLLYRSLMPGRRRHWPTAALSASLFFLAGGVLCETLTFYDKAWALGIAISWLMFPLATLTVVGFVVTDLVMTWRTRGLVDPPEDWEWKP